MVKLRNANEEESCSYTKQEGFGRNLTALTNFANIRRKMSIYMFLVEIITMGRREGDLLTWEPLKMESVRVKCTPLSMKVADTAIIRMYLH